MSQDPSGQDGQLYTLGLLEQLRAESKELWDRHAKHIRWTIGAVGHVTIAQATFDAAVAEWPRERFTLRHGIRLIREHP
jgi:hypothetical protein